jgi:antitoxin YefM
MAGDSITDACLRDNLAEVMDSVCDAASHVLVTRQDKEPIVLMSHKEFRGLEETVYLLSSPANAEQLLQSIAELNAGGLAEYHPAVLREDESKTAA